MHKIFLILFIAVAASSPAHAADVIRLADGRIIKIPSDVDAGNWAAGKIAKKDLKAVSDACRRAQTKSARVVEVCSRAEHLNALNQL